ncbi:hypothetical protein [Vibrio cholerae]|uniref:hypothetical protein n=1 Tax=Vibrio cholerae TaxID=666 RepID=UPI0013C3581A|nr:hypothetical protein [Vibrio cholerae]
MTAIYIISAIAMVIGLMTLYAPNIEKWCDNSLRRKMTKTRRRGRFLFQTHTLIFAL